MHFTGTVYRNPYWPTEPLLEVTQGCTHNSCKFCTMYKDVPFRMSPIEWVEEDLQELAVIYPDAETIQLVGANPLCMKFEYIERILDLVNKYLPKMKNIYFAGRVSDLKNKTVDQLKILKEKGMKEISLGVESGDDWTLDRINKGYHAKDIIEQCLLLPALHGAPEFQTAVSCLSIHSFSFLLYLIISIGNMHAQIPAAAHH